MEERTAALRKRSPRYAEAEAELARVRDAEDALKSRFYLWEIEQKEGRQ